jgi:hypothetical protein
LIYKSQQNICEIACSNCQKSTTADFQKIRRKNTGKHYTAACRNIKIASRIQLFLSSALSPGEVSREFSADGPGPFSTPRIIEWILLAAILIYLGKRMKSSYLKIGQSLTGEQHAET